MCSIMHANDWGIKRFLELVLLIQISMWGVLGLDYIGLHIPIIRQVIGFIYLIYVPGILILRLMKLHNLGNIETILYTVGLSITTIMFVGLFANTVFPIIGILKPISINPLIISMSFLILILSVLCYFNDNYFPRSDRINSKIMSYNPVLFLFLVPFVSIFGAHFVNFYNDSIFVIFTILLIVLIVFLVLFDIFILKESYPLAIYIIALSLLFHQSLISTHITGWDIQHEYYISNLVIANSFWDSSLYFNTNAMLSIVMLVPIFSKICSMDPIWVLKLIYPLIFALVPLGLYKVFQKQTNNKIAFLSCFFFVSINTFYVEMTALARQQIAELFVVLLILLMINKKINKVPQTFLFIIFGFSLVVSHYGLSYIYLFSFIFAWFLLGMSKSDALNKLVNYLCFKFSFQKYNHSIGNIFIFNRSYQSIISMSLMLLFIVFTLSWYIYNSSSSAFNSIVYIGNHILSRIFLDFLDPNASQGLYMLSIETHSTIHHINKIINYLNQIFIIIGVIYISLKKEKIKFEKDYVAFSLVYLSLLFASVLVPFFAASLNISRVYQISLLFLAPFSVIGMLVVFRKTCDFMNISWTDQSLKKYLKICSIYFVMFFLYQVGFVYQVTEGSSCSIALDTEYDYPTYNEQEVLGADWLYDVKGVNYSIYADVYRSLLLNGFNWGSSNSFYLKSNSLSDEFKNVDDLKNNLPIIQTAKEYYLYLGHRNVLKNEVLVYYTTGVNKKKEYIDCKPMIKTLCKVYDNGGANVYFQ